MDIKIHVTKHDINDGIALKCDVCPVALSVRRALALNPTDFVQVTGRWIKVGMNNKRYFCENSDRLSKFVANFDHGMKVKPTSFNLEFKEEED